MKGALCVLAMLGGVAAMAQVKLPEGEGKETVLKANDSCVIEPNETREIVNRGNEVCTIVVAVANPPK